jgi:hypothetical protein
MRTIRTAERREKFLYALEQGLSVGAAARAAGMGRSAAFDWKASDPLFAKHWEEAYSQGTDLFEDALRSAAASGDIAAIIFALKCRRPEVYRRKVIEPPEPVQPVPDGYGKPVVIYQPGSEDEAAD